MGFIIKKRNSKKEFTQIDISYEGAQNKTLEKVIMGIVKPVTALGVELSTTEEGTEEERHTRSHIKCTIQGDQTARNQVYAEITILQGYKIELVEFMNATAK